MENMHFWEQYEGTVHMGQTHLSLRSRLGRGVITTIANTCWLADISPAYSASSITFQDRRSPIQVESLRNPCGRGDAVAVARATQASHTDRSLSLGRRLCPPSSICSTFRCAFIVAFGKGSFPWQQLGNRLSNFESLDMDSIVEKELL